MSETGFSSQEERIGHFEAILNEAAQALAAYERALEAFAAAQKRIKALDGYYGSREWWADVEASDAGRLPAELPCGVLSEDGVWNLLERNRELLAETGAMLERLDAEEDAPAEETEA